MNAADVIDKHDIIRWQIFHLSQALTRAKRMEKHRADWFASLYDSIVYPSVNLDYNNPVMHSAKVDNQAIRIIGLKERYDKKMQQEYEKHLRWKDLLAWAGESDKHLLIRYFQKKKYLEPHIVLSLLKRLEERVEHEEFMMDMEGNERAMEEFKEHRKDFHDKYMSKVPLDGADKKQYLVNGKFVYMTPEEYEAEKVRSREESNRKMEEMMEDIRERRELEVQI